MKNIALLLLCFTANLLFAQDNQVQFVFDHQVNGEQLTLNSTEFDIWNNKNTILERAEFYISEISLIAQDNSEIALTDVYLLVNVLNGDAPYPVGNWDISEVKGVKLHVGVDADHNHLDPTSYPQSHPLAPQNPSMHWGWAAGYRFMAIEGNIDNNGDNAPESLFQFHNLGDNLYYEASLTGLALAENGELTINITLDYAKLFNNMNMTGNLIHHGSDADNKLMLDNAAFNGFFTMDGSNSTFSLEKNADLIQIGPNPANQSTDLNFDFSEFGPSVSFTVSNAAGQILSKTGAMPSQGNFHLETGHLAAGMHLVSVFENGKLIAVKQLQVIH